MEEVILPHNKDITYFAKTNFRNSEQLFGIKRKDRRQHMYVLGKSGTGKSVLLSNMIVQNIRNGEGVCVVDPHGELVEEILESIPESRMKDVIYFNPADTDYHIGFNVLQLDDPKYKHLVASGLMGIFTKIWANAWSARMEYILNNAILALLDTPGTTLLGIPRLLVDKEYRQIIINNLKDPVVKAFWVHEYEQWRDQFRNEAIAPIQNKVGQFLSTSIIRNVVGQGTSTIDIFDVMNSGKIFLVNVSKGRIGEDNSALLGGMLITKIQLAAMERVRIPEDERKDFYLYVDEFQNFATDAFAGILSEARKYRLNLTLAHQYTAQLVTESGSNIRDAVFGNVGTMIVFRVGGDDAEFLEKEFEPEFTPQDIVNLPNYHIYLKLMVDGVTSRPFSAKTLPPLKPEGGKEVALKIIASSRELYTRPRQIVEEEINKWSGMSMEYSQNDEGKFPAECSSCKKSIKVPFEPAPGRPVYCRDCLAKIKSGELQPAKGFSPKRQPEQRSVEALSILGIEFTEPKNSKNIQNNHVAPHTSRPQTIVPPKVVPVIPKNNIPTQPPVVRAPVVKPEIPKIVQPVKVFGIPKPQMVIAPKPPVVVPKIPVINQKADNEDLKSILAQAVSSVLDVKPEPVIAKAPEVKAMPLSDLKKPEPVKVPQPLPSKKDATPEHLSGLREAIAKATEKKQENIIKEKVEEKIEEEKKEEKPKKKKEIPEDVLRKVLE